MPAPTPSSAPPPSGQPPHASAAPELRRHLLHLVLAVVVLDVAVIAVHRLAGVEGWPGERQRWFTIGWVALSLAVASVFLQRIRAARVRARRARAGRQ